MVGEVFVTVFAIEAGDSMCVCVFCDRGEGMVVVLVQEQGVASPHAVNETHRPWP